MNTIKRTKYSLLPCIVFGSVAVVSFTLGYFFVNSNLDNQAPPVTADRGKITNDSVVADESRADLVEVDTLLDLTKPLKFKSNFERTLALHTLLEQADVTVLHGYWDQLSQLNTGIFRHEIQNGIVQRWAVLDPIAAISVLTEESNSERRNLLLDLVYREWSRANLEAVLDYVAALDESSKFRAVSSILREREDLSSETRREIARRLDHEWLVFEVGNDTIASPSREWSSFLNQYQDQLEHIGNAQYQLMAHIANAWVLQDGIDAFNKLREQLPQTFSLLEPTRIVTHNLLNDNPRLAIDLIVDRIQNETDTEYQSLALQLIEQWAEVDPKSALDSTFVIEARGLRLRLQHRAVRTWAESEPATIMAELNELPDHLQSYTRDWALTAIASTSPKQVLTMLRDITDPVALEDVARTLVDSWAHHDFSETLHWIETDARIEHLREDLKRSAFHGLAGSNPQMAMEFALKEPVNKGEVGMEASVIHRVSLTGQIDVAVSMLSQVRAGKTRSRAYDFVISKLILDDDITRTMDLLLELSEKQTTDLDRPLATIAWQAPNALFASLERIESEPVRAEAARILYKKNRDNGRFTDEELAHLQGLIQSQHSSRLNSARDRIYEVLFDNE